MSNKMNRVRLEDLPPTLRVMRSVGDRPFPWFIVEPNGHVLPQLFNTREAAEAHRQTLLAKHQGDSA